MTVIAPHEVAWSTARPENNSEFVGFLDSCFGRPAGRSLRREFPTALAPTNSDHHYQGFIDGRRVCAATALVKTWLTGSGSVEVACVGCFSTDPDLRGRGLSARIQEFGLDCLRAEGVQWAALWTDQPEIYEGRGFRPAGQEFHGSLAGIRWPECNRSQGVRPASIDDAPAILDLYEEHRLRAIRSLDEVSAHLSPSMTRAWVLEERGQIQAYACLGKGEDFPGYVHDYAGPVDAVHVLWGVAVAAGAEAVLIPAGAEHYAAGAAEGIRGLHQPAALIVEIAPGPAPSDTAFAVWGADSA